MSEIEITWAEGQVTEKLMEDWAEEHLAAYIHPNAYMLGRQVTLPSGKRLDLLFRHDRMEHVFLTVVEMKVGKAGMDAVLQCLRYVSEIRECAYENVTVRGVVAAEYFENDARAVVAAMSGMAMMQLDPYVHMHVEPLYKDGRYGPWPVPPPDVDRTAPDDRLRSHSAERREAIRVTLTSLVDQAHERGASVRTPRKRALVPLSLDPRRVAYTNGNGAGP